LNSKNKSAVQPASYYSEGIRRGDISILSKAITLVESTRDDHLELAGQVLDAIMPFTGKSFRLGVTGVPGVGKSTFIESVGMNLVAKGKKLAVLAIDPSSTKSGGSILGDKTRMETLSASEGVFIRPSPSGSKLGGVTRATYETILLCEAAGFDFIIVETVGVGQSEVAVSRITDFFLLLMLAGAGDQLQGIKRGIMEMADALVITKADGDNVLHAKSARAEYAQAMHFLQAHEGGWTPPTLLCSALNKDGLDEIVAMFESYHLAMTNSGYFEAKRKQQLMQILKENLDERLLKKVYQKYELNQKLHQLESLGVKNPFREAEKLSDL
jgi:LAO/AO transport system kinase